MLTTPETPAVTVARDALLAAYTQGNRFAIVKATEGLFAAMFAASGGKLEEFVGDHPMDVQRAEKRKMRERQLIRCRAEHMPIVRQQREDELKALVERRDQLAAGHAELRREASAIPAEDVKLIAQAAVVIEEADNAMSAIVAQIAAAEGMLETARTEEAEAAAAEATARETDAANAVFGLA